MISTDLPLIYPTWNAPKNVFAYTSTRRGGVSFGAYSELNVGDHVGDSVTDTKKNRSLLPFINQIQWMKQVHGDQVITIDSVSNNAVTGDGLVSERKNVFCAVMTADCLPILITNLSGDKVAAVHAGWKGLANGVIEKAVKALSTSSNSTHTNNLMAWIGPAICARCYEVDESVKQYFKTYDKAFQRNKNKRFDFDLSLVAATQLNQLGVNDVTQSNLCTYCDSERFFSHRRSTHQQELTCGRQVSVIGFL